MEWRQLSADWGRTWTRAHLVDEQLVARCGYRLLGDPRHPFTVRDLGDPAVRVGPAAPRAKRCAHCVRRDAEG